VIFRREPLHKKLAREARLEQGAEEGMVDPGPHWGVTGIHGVPRPRRWDAVASAEAPGLTGDEIHFVALPNGDLVVDEDEPPDTLGPLADAIEQTLEAPYRAEAVRQGEGVWAVAARRLVVSSFEAQGDELERIGREQGEHHVVRASRLDGDAWEIEADPL
jgi:hypothetical protein